MNIARLNYQTSDGTTYLKYLHELGLHRLITPSQDRNLTPYGLQAVKDNGLTSSLDIGKLVRAVQVLRQGRPDLSELDAFVCEAADCAHALSPDAEKQAVDVYECKRLFPRKGTFVLAGIYVLREATKQRLLEVNPAGSPNDQCYVKYV